VAGTLLELLEVDFGEPLHSLILVGHLHPVEADYLKLYAVNPESIDKYLTASVAAVVPKEHMDWLALDVTKSSA